MRIQVWMIAAMMAIGVCGLVRATEPPEEQPPAPTPGPAGPAPAVQPAAEPSADEPEGDGPGATEEPEAQPSPPFELTPPEGWVVIQQDVKRMVLAREGSPTPVPTTLPMVVVTKSAKVFTDETVKRKSVIQFGDDLKRWNFKGQPKVEKISVNGISGYECIRKGAMIRDESKQRVYVGKLFVDNGNFVILGYCPDDDEADSNLEAFKAITRSLKPRG